MPLLASILLIALYRLAALFEVIFTLLHRIAATPRRTEAAELTYGSTYGYLGHRYSLRVLPDPVDAHFHHHSLLLQAYGCATVDQQYLSRMLDFLMVTEVPLFVPIMGNWGEVLGDDLRSGSKDVGRYISQRELVDGMNDAMMG